VSLARCIRACVLRHAFATCVCDNVCVSHVFWVSFACRVSGFTCMRSHKEPYLPSLECSSQRPIGWNTILQSGYNDTSRVACGAGHWAVGTHSPFANRLMVWPRILPPPMVWPRILPSPLATARAFSLRQWSGQCWLVVRVMLPRCAHLSAMRMCARGTTCACTALAQVFAVLHCNALHLHKSLLSCTAMHCTCTSLCCLALQCTATAHCR
jgi:hypothetical protein